MKITDLTSDRHIRDETAMSLVQELRTQFETLTHDYLFDEKDAEALYQTEREKADRAALQVRLRGAVPPSSESTPHVKVIKQRPPKLQPQILAPHVVVSDIFDEGSEESVGGIFEILGDMPTSETNAQGTTVKIRDMALPKHWSGRTPKNLLSETVAKADRYAAITYSILSHASRAKRAAVSIRWEGRKTGEWVMEDTACHDESQAEQYIATVALHTLTFPSTDGFAAGASGAPGAQTFFRLLPAVFRDLWDELEVARKTRDDAINRGVWAKLRSIAGPKLQNSDKASVSALITTTTN
jgi:ATP-dependent RNA helicase DHX29